ncbi:MAG: alpha/beta hydrolase [Bacteroidetes bacterium]|nr:alpha/beta hydrolase [Bacteroidota bacterium]
MPILLFLPFILNLFTIGLIILDIRLFQEWHEWKGTYCDDYAKRCLYGAIALTLYSLAGSIPLKYILSKKRKNEDEPKQEHSSNHEMLARPDGSVINIEFYGDPAAQPVLFVHGWMANSTEWYYQKKFFASTNRVILIDLPGLGKSKRPDNADFSLQKMASDLEAVIHHLKLHNVILWGHSIGGMTILTYCTQIGKDVSQHVKGVILEHTTFTNPVYTGIMSGFFTAIEKPVLYPACYLMIALSPLFWINKWMSYLNGHAHVSTRFTSFTGTQTSQQLDFITRLSTIAPPSVTARGMLGMMKTYDVTDTLPLLTVPALILAADKDRLTKPVASEYMHKNIASSQLITVTPGGHQGLIERHTEVNLAASRFMDGLKKPTII